MFTGIVQRVGRIVEARPTESGRRLAIDAAGWEHQPRPGSSIAVSGCCLTVVSNGPSADRMTFDVIPQTLAMTTLGDLEPGDRVNLEPAVTPTTMLGGHIVQGHVDGIGTVERVVREADEWRLRIRPPAALMDCIVPTGSISLAGVALTLAAVADDHFEVALIPTTLELTTLDELSQGDRVNLETDYVAKTIVNWLERQRLGRP